MQRRIVGKVFSGTGRGAFFTSLRGYKTQLTQLLGAEPSPGTLNLRVDLRAAEGFLHGQQTRVLTGFTENGHEYGKLFVTKVIIDNQRAYLVIPEKTFYKGDVFEIISEYSLREVLNLRNGDRVAVRRVTDEE